VGLKNHLMGSERLLVRSISLCSLPNVVSISWRCLI
jgi:hypothetical protein